MRNHRWTEAEYMARVTVRPDGCWEWRGKVNNSGYHVADVGDGTGRATTVHRIGYELFVGPIAADLDGDHLCHRRWCVNPHHIEPVTHRENIRRMPGLFGRRARATRCDRGHDDWQVDRDGRRRCMTCRREAQKRRAAA